LKEIIIIVISAFVGGVITFFFDRIKESREEKKKEFQQKEEERKNRPEYKIIEMKDYFDNPGVNVREKTCDVEVFLLPIESVKIEENDVVAKYDKSMLDKDLWVCREYTLKNVGNTTIYDTDIVSVIKKRVCLFDVRLMTKEYLEFGSLNYSELYDNRIGVGENFTLKLCYNQDKIIGGTMSANLVIGIRDDNGDCWMQPFFAPDDKLYKSSMVPYKDYKDELRSDIAIECFKNPNLW